MAADKHDDSSGVGGNPAVGVCVAIALGSTYMSGGQVCVARVDYILYETPPCYACLHLAKQRRSYYYLQVVHTGCYKHLGGAHCDSVCALATQPRS